MKKSKLGEVVHTIRVVKMGSIFKVVRDLLFLGLLVGCFWYAYKAVIFVEAHHGIQNQYFETLGEMCKKAETSTSWK